MAADRPGPAPQTAERKEIARLITGGMSNVHASRMVGINSRTGETLATPEVHQQHCRRLRYPPVITTPGEISHRGSCPRTTGR